MASSATGMGSFVWMIPRFCSSATAQKLTYRTEQAEAMIVMSRELMTEIARLMISVRNSEEARVRARRVMAKLSVLRVDYGASSEQPGQRLRGRPPGLQRSSRLAVTSQGSTGESEREGQTSNSGALSQPYMAGRTVLMAGRTVLRRPAPSVRKRFSVVW